VSETHLDPLEGISDKTSKADMLKRLNELADKLRDIAKARTGKLGEIEARVREKYKPGEMPELHNVVFTATDDEMKEAVSFLEEFEDVLPTALARLRQGGRQLLDEDERAAA
jgi:hypothetical protein